MRALLLSIAAAACVTAGQAEACIAPVREAVRVARYDPFAEGVATETFALALQRRGGQASEAYVQFVDREGQPAGASLGGGPGPFSILALGASAEDLVTGPVMTATPGPVSVNQNWARVPLSERPSLVSFQLRLPQRFAPAGLYSQTLDLRVACRRPDGSFETIEFPAAVEIVAAVANSIRLDTPRASIDLGALAPDGPAAQGRIDLRFASSGPFEVEVRSTNGAALGLPGGALLRQGAGGRQRTADAIDYDFEADGVSLSNGARLACAARTGALPLTVQTAPAPGAGRVAGDYADILEVTLTPRFGSAPIGGGCAPAR